MTSNPAKRDSNAAMPFIMLTVLIDMMSVGLTVPVLAPLMGSFTTSQADQAFWYGVVVVAFAIGNFFASPILGALSDAYGRRPVLLLGFCGLALNFFATGFATALWMLVAVRLVGGAMQANGAVANAYVADITATPEERARRFGMLGAMFGLGFILGPVVGGLLGSIHLQLPFIVAGSLALINLLYGCFVLPESLPPERRRPFAWRMANPFTSLRALARLDGNGRLVTAFALTTLAQTIGFIIWVIYGNFKFGWGPQESGWSLAAIGVMSVIVQGVLLKSLLKALGSHRLAMAGMFSASVANVLYGLANEGWMFYAIIVANGLGYIVTSTIQSIISSSADARSQGNTMGAVSSIGSLMAVVAPLLGAPLLALISEMPRGDWRMGAPFYFCCLLQASAAAFALWQFRRDRGRGAAPKPAAEAAG
ncbi:MFS transporter [Pseudoduganella violacea]|uniref:DHA1 family tetracycline resistance protein-like MFS transporter n=1 Tax=Pseudoduganella violacea TaxID=1715466 RepID=A0A7W5BDI4_9BURK|nr:MFS transporter [Pseudoduganella violacea]MBB3120933.1 DHA1 family tetracycline resistance protein-like MFS transporter [Pseudoduganella violacea]